MKEEQRTALKAFLSGKHVFVLGKIVSKDDLADGSVSGQPGVPPIELLAQNLSSPLTLPLCHVLRCLLRPQL